MTPTARPRSARYRSQPDVATAMAAPWQPSEKQFMALVTDIAERLGWAVYHPFDSRRSTAGFPDLTLVRPPRLVFVELKVGTYQPTDAQLAWLDLLAQCGVEAYVMRSTGDRVQDAMGIGRLLTEKPEQVAA
jgi:hypothetical protein